MTTAMVGGSSKKVPSLSSASATMNSPLPSLAFVPQALSLPPMTTVGSRPPRASTVETIEVVVVFPCAPATRTEYLRRISSASISARRISGTLGSFRAAWNSGFSSETADETTTTSAPLT